MKEIIEKAKQWALEEIEKNGAPSLLNFNTSNQKGQELAEKLGADKDIVLLGTMLMDISLGECWKENKIPEHVPRGVSAVEKFLAQFKISEDVKAKIINCVEAHHGGKYKCKEAEICANADCYRFISPNNVFGFITDLVKKEGWSLTKTIKFAYSKLEEKHKILSIDICKKELEEDYQAFKELFEKAKPEK